MPFRSRRRSARARPSTQAPPRRPHFRPALVIHSVPPDLRVIVRLSPEAEADLTEAFAWYRERGSRLGDEFIRSFDAVVQALRATPKRSPRFITEFAEHS